MKKTEAIQALNFFGSEQKPCVFILSYDMQHNLVMSPQEANNAILYDFEGLSNVETIPILNKTAAFSKKPIEYALYCKSFNNVIQQINIGNSYLTNLTAKTEIETNLSLEEIFYHSNAKYKLLVKDKFVVFSPEIFVKIENNKISSYPMKGTIDAEIPNAKTILLNDVKETAEHTTIVDLIRNDLSIVSKNVRVEEFRYIDELKTNQKHLLQMSSKIVGDLEEGYWQNLGDLIFSLLPAGSISGAPKKKTVEIIREAETYERGFYTGIMGYFDGLNLTSSVMIRFVEKENNRLFYKSGGGITTFSDCRKEYQELIDKVYLPIK